MTENELQELAKQLGNPSGEFGKIVAKNMHEGNISMTNHAVELLQIKGKQKILEIGHGNAHHVTEILKTHTEIQYFGIDISALMHKEAVTANQTYIQNNRADFQLYDGLELPYPKNLFDGIFSVNTVYFWENPQAFLQEIYRVCSPNGHFCLTFADADFMKTLPFTDFGFQLYDLDMIKKWCIDSGFSIVETQQAKDHVKSKSGEMVHRLFYTLVLKKLS